MCILGSVAPHPKESVVPQSPADLSDDDRQVLTELGLPQDKWDNLNALLALYNKAENSDVFSVQVSKPGMELSRSYILEQIEFLLKTSTKKHDGGKALKCCCKGDIQCRHVLTKHLHVFFWSVLTSCGPLLWQWQEEYW